MNTIEGSGLCRHGLPEGRQRPPVSTIPKTIQPRAFRLVLDHMFRLLQKWKYGEPPLSPLDVQNTRKNRLARGESVGVERTLLASVALILSTHKTPTTANDTAQPLQQ